MPNFFRESGKPNILPYRKAASTLFADGDAVTVNGSGLLIKANASATPATFIGIITRDVLATDSDYASTGFVGVEVPESGDVFVARVGTGTASQASVGTRCDLDANGRVNLSASVNDVVEVVRFIDASTVAVKFVKN